MGSLNSIFAQTTDEFYKIFKDSNYSFSDIRNYKSYLENNSIDITNEQHIINGFKNNFYKDYLQSLIYKKQNNYKYEFSILFKHLNSWPEYLPYYDELVSAANASDNLNKIKSSIKNVSIKNKFYNYLSGLYFYENGNYNEAYKYFERTLNNINSPEVFYYLSYSQRSLGNYDKAFQFLQKGNDLLKTNDFFIPKFTIAKGSLFYLSGNNEKAKTFYARGLKQADSTGNTIEKIKALVNIGILHDDEGNVYVAREFFNEAIKLAVKINSIELTAFANSEMGVSFTLTHELIDAQKHYKISFDLYKKLNNKTRLAFLSNNLGNLKMNFADYNSALKYYNQGLNYSGENKRAQIQNLTGIAGVYQNLSDFTKAFEYYEKAEKLAVEIKDISLQTEVKLGIGSLFFNINNTRKALNIFKEAEVLISNGKHPFLKTDVYHKIGIAYLELDEYNLAEKYLNNSIDLSQSTGDILSKITATSDLAFLYLNQNKIDKSFAILNDIIPLTEDYLFYNLLGMQKIILGTIYLRKKQFDRAIQLFKEAEIIGEENYNSDLKIEANFQTAEIYNNLENNVEAEKYYLKAVNLIDAVSKNLTGNSEINISYFSNYKDVYDKLTEFYLKQNKYREAFLIIESSRSRNTMQNLSKIKLNSESQNKDRLQKLYELEWMLNSEIYEKDEIDSLKNELQKAKNQLIEQNAFFKKYFDKNDKFSIDKIQSALKRGDNLVSIYVTEDYSQYFLITKDDFISDRINMKREDLLNLIYDISPYFNTQLDNEEIYYNQDLFSFNAGSSYNLYKYFFADIFSKIKNNESIIFNLPPELITLPLEFLVTEYQSSTSPYNYDNRKFLVNDYAVSYTPSFGIYLEQKYQTLGNNNILLLGDPALQNSSKYFSLRRSLLDNDDVFTRLSTLYPLEFSREEVEEINDITINTTLLLADDATETNFKLNVSDKNIIHLSTHTFQYKNQPLVVFSNTNDAQNDGILEAGEIVKLNINSSLIVLSSCRSGLGVIDKAEGIIGMQKAFYEAGAKSMIVSLWDVSDKYTSKFMIEFYKSLSGGKSKSEALRTAKIEFIKKYSSNPYYWSAFVLYGNEDPVELEPASLNYYFILLITACVIIIFIIYIYKRKN